MTEFLINNFKKKNILITGGTGLIGRQIVDYLSHIECNIKIVSLDKINLITTGKKATQEKIYGDLCDFNFCKNITKEIDFVFHIAGVKGSIDVTKKKPSSFFVPLLMMNTNILEASRINKCKKLIYTSSIGAYHPAEIFKEEDHDESKPPMDFFPGWAKRMAELQVQSYRIQYGTNNFSIVRPCNVFGPGDNFDKNNAMVIPSLISRALEGENPMIIWGDGTAIRDFAYSKDVAMGVLKTIVSGTGQFDFLNLGSGIEVTLKELVKTLSEILNFKYEFDSTKPSGFPKRVMDISNINAINGFKPNYSLFEGLKETIDWYRVNKDESNLRNNYFNEN